MSSFTNSQGLNYQITYDTSRVWINGIDGLIARFSETGIDIHGLEHGECLDCRAKFTTAKDWDYFKMRINQLFLIDIDENMPACDTSVRHYLRKGEE